MIRRGVTMRARRLLCALGVLALAPSMLRAQAAPLERRVTLHFRDVALRDALDRLMAVARVRISYSAEQLPLDRSVRASFDTATVATVLTGLLRGVAVLPVSTGGNQIVLTPVRDVRGLVPTPVVVAAAELDRVVVTGTADGGPQRALPVALAVIDGAQAADAGIHDVASALTASVPGVWAWEQSPASLITRYGSIRGASSFGASYPKMYIDGIAVANPLLVTQFDPESVQRIEVIRGPQGAALYGADAISGVLNIVTRHDGVDAGAPRARVRAGAGYAASEYSSTAVLTQDHRVALGLGTGLRTAQLGIGVGSLGAYYSGASSHSVQASAGGRVIGARSVLTGTARFARGAVGAAINPLLVEAATASGRAINPLALRVQPQGLREYTVGTTLKFAPDERWSHTLVAGVDGYALSNVANDFTPFPSSADSALRAASGQADRSTLRVSSVARVGQPERVGATLTLALEHSALRQESPAIKLGRTAMPRGPGVSGARGLLQVMGPPGMPLLVSATDWFSDAGITSQVDLAVRNRWYISGGLRVERNSGYVTEARAHLLPMLGGAWVRDVGGATIKLRSAYGRGIRAPRTAARETLAGGLRAQNIVRDLAPEEQAGIEGGVDLIVGRALTLQVTRFDQRATGLIQQVVIPDNAAATAAAGSGLALQYQNVGAIANRGWEVQATARHRQMSATLAWAFVDSRVRSLAIGYTGDLRPGDRTLGVPARTLSASASWLGARWSGSVGVTRAFDWIEYDRLSLATAYSGFDRAAVPLYGGDLRGYWRAYNGATRLRASATRQMSRGLSLFVTGDNLLDFQRGEPDNATIVPGRTITTGLRISRF
ncbi:MAG: TonB-dependent receptor [Gemmatimonadota bacterium]|nr:TonB-dependent receptor [Gemmatimonadota bacterium]